MGAPEGVIGNLTAPGSGANWISLVMKRRGLHRREEITYKIRNPKAAPATYNNLLSLSK